MSGSLKQVTRSHRLPSAAEADPANSNRSLWNPPLPDGREEDLKAAEIKASVCQPKWSRLQRRDLVVDQENGHRKQLLKKKSRCFLTTTRANPITVMMPKGTSIIPIPAPSPEAMGSCVEFRRVSLVEEVMERNVVLDVRFCGSVLVSTELEGRGTEVVRGREGFRVGNGVSVWVRVEVNRSGLAVVMVPVGRRRVYFRFNPAGPESSSSLGHYNLWSFLNS